MTFTTAYETTTQTKADNMHKICIWSDYDWCYIDDIFLYNHKSDDFITVALNFDEEPTIEQLKQALGE